MSARRAAFLPRLLAACWLAVVLAGPAVAQQPAAPAPAAAPAAPAASDPAAVQQKLDGWANELGAIEQAVGRPGTIERELSELRARTDDIRAAASALALELAPRVGAIEARLKELGPEPKAKEGEATPAESDAVKAARAEQSKLLADVQGLARQAQVVQVRADQVITAIADKRRQRFTSELLERHTPLIQPSLWWEAARGLPGVVTSASLLVGDWARVIDRRADGATLALLVGIVLLAAILVMPVRRFLSERAARDPDAVDPPRLKRFGAAAAIVLVFAAVPAVALGLVQFALDAFDLLPTRVETVLAGLFTAIVLATSLQGLARAILAPSRPRWRLVDLDDATAATLERWILAWAVLVAADLFSATLLDQLFAPIAVIVATSGALSAAQALVVMVLLRTFGHGLSAREDAAASAETPLLPGAVVEPAGGLAWRWVLPAAWLLVVAVLVAVTIGYVRLADFLASQLAWSGVVLAALFVVVALADEAVTATFQPTTPVGVALTRSMGFARETVEQIGVVLSGLAKLVLGVAGALLLAAPFGITTGDLFGNARAAFWGFQIGGFTFSLSTLFAALAVFVLGIAVARAIQGWLEKNFLPKTRLDVGLRNSIKTGVGYVGFVAATMVAFSTAGLDLQNLAIVAGALSVGIGFGLQSIVNNFVSGLILLAERPIKSGDLVEVGSQKGYVRKINVRSTEIETFDRASLIVPNSALISGNVKNWMHRDTTGRVDVTIGVDYDADPDKVREVLLACAREHPQVLAFPEPAVFFTAFGENSLDFRLLCAVGNIAVAYKTESDLRFAIFRTLREAGIAVPFAQRDINIKNVDEIIELGTRLFGEAAPKPEVSRPPSAKDLLP